MPHYYSTEPSSRQTKMLSRRVTTSVAICCCFLLLLWADYAQAKFHNHFKMHHDDTAGGGSDEEQVEFMAGDQWKFQIGPNNLSAPECGMSIATNRIVGGKAVDDFLYPFAVIIAYHGSATGGGSIIGDRWILTAAHLFHRSQDPEDFHVGIGSNFLDDVRLVPVEKVFIHRRYRRKQLFDIAMLKLQTPLQFSRKVQPICLPKYSMEPINFDRARVIGWGFLAFELKRSSPILREVDLELIPIEKCRKIYSVIPQPIIRSQICTWNKGKDSCSGDSGGPLFIYQNDRAVLFGLVSFGVTCADQFPGVYTAVSYYLNWINKNIKEND